MVEDTVTKNQIEEPLGSIFRERNKPGAIAVRLPGNRQ
jgi:hypothetical protein